MTTTTTVAALNTGRESTPDEPSATENAQSAGIEQRETKHVDPAGTGSARADMAEDSGRAHRLVWLDPRELAVHPRNIRDDLGDLSGLAASIAAQGVLEALTVIPQVAADGAPGHQLVAGHRRAAAAIKLPAGLPARRAHQHRDLRPTPVAAAPVRPRRHTHPRPRPPGEENPVIFEPRAADIDPVDIENALLRAALGDYSDEAAILLLITSGHWLPQLQHTGLITFDGNVDGEGLWAHVNWPDLDAAVRIEGDHRQQ